MALADVRQVKSKKKLYTITAIIVVFVLLVVVLVSVLRPTNIAESIVAVNTPSEQAAIGVSLNEAWDKREYSEVIRISNQLLAQNQLDFKALLYKGFASFYIGISLQDIDQRKATLQDASLILQQILQLEPHRNNSDVFYLLGKIYYHRGYYFHDLSKIFLDKANAAGYTSTDLLEYLGLISSELGNYNEAIQYFESALKLDNRDVVYLALANAQAGIDQYTAAMATVDHLNQNSKDPVIRQKALIIKGDLLLRQGKIDEAIIEYQKLVTENPKDADAHFYLGEAYEAKGDTIKARAGWREAITLNPGHVGALSRLNS